MTLEEVLIQKPSERAQCTGKALEEVLASARANDSLTIGVYESAKVMNVWVCCPLFVFFMHILIKLFDWFNSATCAYNWLFLQFQWPRQRVFLRPGDGWGVWVRHRSANSLHSHPSVLFWQRHQHRSCERHATSLWDCWWQSRTFWRCPLRAYHGMYAEKNIVPTFEQKQKLYAFATFGAPC